MAPRKSFDFEGPNYEAWDNVDVFTLPQAAHLWAGEDPNVPFESSNFEAYLTMLKNAILNKRLVPKLTLEQRTAFQRDPEFAIELNIKATREELKQYANAIDKKPEFLFRDDEE